MHRVGISRVADIIDATAAHIQIDNGIPQYSMIKSFGTKNKVIHAETCLH